MLYNSRDPDPLNTVERFASKQKKISISRLNLIKHYNEAMGGVDLVDAAVAIYQDQN